MVAESESESESEDGGERGGATVADQEVILGILEVRVLRRTL